MFTTYFSSLSWLVISALSCLAMLRGDDGKRVLLMVEASSIRGGRFQMDGRPLFSRINKIRNPSKFGAAFKEHGGTDVPGDTNASSPTSGPTTLNVTVACPETPPLADISCSVIDYADVTCRYNYQWIGCEEPMTCKSLLFCSCDDGAWMCAQMGMEGCLSGFPDKFGETCTPTPV